MEYINYLIYPNKIVANIMQHTGIGKITFAKTLIIVMITILIIGFVKDFIRHKAFIEIYKKYPDMKNNKVPLKEQISHFVKWWVPFWLIFSIIAIPAAKIDSCTYEIQFNEQAVSSIKNEKTLKCADYWTRDNNWTNFENKYMFLNEKIDEKKVFYNKINNDLKGYDEQNYLNLSDNYLNETKNITNNS